MKHTRKQKMEKLLAEAQGMIEEFLDWEEKADKPNLTQIEDVVLRLRERIGERMAEVAIADQDAKQPAEAPKCPTCDETMRYKGQKGTDAETRMGRLEIERGHYYCARCQSGLFPLDTQLELVDGHWSEGVACAAVWVSGVVSSFEHAQAVLERIGRINIASASVWRRVQVWGAKFREVLEAERQQSNAIPAKWDPPSRAEKTDQRMGVSMDGTMIHIRQEGWKELKVGDVFEVAVRPTIDERSKEVQDLAHAVNNTYVAHLGGPEALGELLWAEARRRDWEQAQDTEALGDAAPWIWNQVSLHFSDSRQLVDWYHAKEHLAEAAKLLKGEGTPALVRWLNSRGTLLYQGHADRISCELEQAATEKTGDISDALRREAGYFWQNQHRMNYLEMREEEWPIGSGMVESAGKRFKTRFAGPGMRWSRPGAENLLPVRCAILSGRFDETWTKTHSSPQT